MINNIVFDFDGTLVDSNKIKSSAFFKITERFGDVSQVVRDVLVNTKGDRSVIISAIVSKLSETGVISSEASLNGLKHNMLREYTDLCEREIAVCNEINGASRVLLELSKTGYSLFLNSATPTPYLKRITDLRGMTPFFRGIYGAPENKVQNLAKIKSDFRIENNETILFVGDGEDDYQASRTFKCMFAGVVHEKYQFSDAITYQLTNMEQLPALLKKLSSI